MDITIILQSLVQLFGVITFCVLSFVLWKARTMIATKIGNESLVLLDTIVKTLVTAAEQTYDKDKGNEKKAVVLNQLKTILGKYGLTFDESELDATIESNVLKLHNELRITESLESNTNEITEYSKENTVSKTITEDDLK